MFNTEEVRNLKKKESLFFIAVSLFIGLFFKAGLTLTILLVYLALILILKVKDTLKGMIVANFVVLLASLIR